MKIPSLFPKQMVGVRLVLLLIAVISASLLCTSSVSAQAAAPTPPAATLEQRVTDLEQYFQNASVGGPTGTTWTSKIAGVPGPGDNAWLIVASALVLFMTLPGLGLFYGGLVRQKNVLSVLAQCLSIAGLVIIIWWAVGYSLAFGTSFTADRTHPTLLGSILGGTDYFFLKGITGAPNTDYSYWVSQNIFSMFQLMFAIITPALIVGAVAERMKFSAVLLFVTLWMFIVYLPMAHMVWGITGMMNGVWNATASIKAIDFAGGTVVHMSSGWSALILCMMLGKRLGFGKEHMAPHSMVLCMVGTGMLWVGWYGFNAGSALAADGIAANAFVTTTLAAGVASFVWAMLEYIIRKKPSVLGFCSGAVAGLVVITPACGFVTPNSAVIIGILAGVIPFIFVMKLKGIFGYDDALDTFGVHAVGGTLGALVTGIFASVDANANLATNLKDIVGKTLWLEQLKAIGVTLMLSIVGTIIIASIVKAVIGLRASPEVETEGLDLAEHGEEGYIMDHRS
ncbi:MAG: ammonium transporter [Chthoniobacterales bacterium]